MKVLVTGANGFLGRHVVATLLAQGHEVRALVRPASNIERLGWGSDVEVFRADLRGGTDLAPAFEGVDALVHLATQMVGDDFTILSGTLTGTERLFTAMAGSDVKRLVLCSSFSVYDWTAVRGRHREDSPLATDTKSIGGYAVAKQGQEELARRGVAEHGWELTILRPGFIWGRGNEDLPCIGQRFGRWQVVFGPRRRLALAHVENCASAFVAVLENDASKGEVFNLVDDDEVTAMRYARDQRERTHNTTTLVRLPYVVTRFFVSCVNFVSRIIFDGRGKLPSMFVPVRFELRYKPLRFSNKKLLEKLGWRPPLNYDACLDRTYATAKAPKPKGRNGLAA